MPGELNGDVHECNCCHIPMIAASVGLDWCRQCGSIWQWQIRMFSQPTGVKPLEKPVENPKASKPKRSFFIPSGKYKGVEMDTLDTVTLERVWAGFNGTKYAEVARILREELDKRKGIYRGSLYRG